jgi:hypothetical protein
MKAVRFSTLKHLSRSPAHYRHAIESPFKDNAAMRIGRLVHWHLLGGMPDDEDGRIVIYDGERRGLKWAAFEAEHDGAEIVTAKEWEKALPIADAVTKHELASSLLAGCTLEQHLPWAIHDRAFSSRPDAFRDGAHVIDLKTTTNCSPMELQRQAWKMHYHVQLAMYSDALAYHGIKVPSRYIIGVEVAPPHIVTVLELSDALIELGRRTYLGWYEALRVCESSDYWPGYAQQPVPWDVPAWFEVEEEMDDDDDEEEAAA